MSARSRVRANARVGVRVRGRGRVRGASGGLAARALVRARACTLLAGAMTRLDAAHLVEVGARRHLSDA